MIKVLHFLCALIVSQIAIAPVTIAWSYGKGEIELDNGKPIYSQSNNSVKLIRNKRYSQRYPDILELINQFSVHVISVASAIEGHTNYFNYLHNSLNSKLYADHLRETSTNMKTLATSDYDIKTLTASLKNYIKILTSVPNEIADVSVKWYPHFNGGDALRSLVNSIDIISTMVETLGAKLLEAENKLVGLNNKQNEIYRLQNELRNSESKINKLDSTKIELKEKLEAALKAEKSNGNQHVTELENHKLKIEVLNEKLKNANQKISDLEENKVKMEQEKATVDEKLREYINQTQNLEQELNKVKVTKSTFLTEREEQLHKTNSNIKNLEDKLSNFNNQLDNLQKERSALIDYLKHTSSTKLKKEIDKLEEENEKSKEEIKDLKNQNTLGMPNLIVKVIKDKIKELMTLLDNNNKLINEKQIQLNNDVEIKENRIIELERILDEVRLEKDDVKKQLEQLKEARTDLEKITTQFKALDPDAFFKIVMEKYRNQVNNLNTEIVTLLATICPK